MSKMRRILSGGEDGFTLIELLVVIAVLGILAAIAIPRLGGVTDKARNSEYESISGSIRSGMEMYAAEYGNYPSSATDWSTLLTESAIGQYLEVEQPDGFVDFNDSNIDGTTSINDDDYDIYMGNSVTETEFHITPGGVSSSVNTSL